MNRDRKGADRQAILLVELGEQFEERHFEGGILRAQDSVFGFVDAIRRVDPCAAGARVDHPDVAHSEFQLVVNAFLHAFV